MLNKTALFALGFVLAVAGPAGAILRQERLLRRGRTVLLELAPVDPRSLMQGDYMALNYAVGSGLSADLKDGHLVLRDDAQGVGRLVRIDDGKTLDAGEYRLRYRMRYGRTVIGGNSWFIQEGTGQAYAHAAYGELRAAPSGEVILVGLRESGTPVLTGNSRASRPIPPGKRISGL